MSINHKINIGVKFIFCDFEEKFKPWDTYKHYQEDIQSILDDSFIHLLSTGSYKEVTNEDNNNLKYSEHKDVTYYLKLDGNTINVIILRKQNINKPINNEEEEEK